MEDWELLTPEHTAEQWTFVVCAMVCFAFLTMFVFAVSPAFEDYAGVAGKTTIPVAPLPTSHSSGSTDMGAAPEVVADAAWSYEALLVIFTTLFAALVLFFIWLTHDRTMNSPFERDARYQQLNEEYLERLRLNARMAANPELMGRGRGRGREAASPGHEIMAVVVCNGRRFAGTCLFNYCMKMEYFVASFEEGLLPEAPLGYTSAADAAMEMQLRCLFAAIFDVWYDDWMYATDAQILMLNRDLVFTINNTPGSQFQQVMDEMGDAHNFKPDIQYTENFILSRAELSLEWDNAIEAAKILLERDLKTEDLGDLQDWSIKRRHVRSEEALRRSEANVIRNTTLGLKEPIYLRRLLMRQR